MSLTDARAETAHDERLFGRPFDARQSQYRSPNGLPRRYRREIATLKQKEAVFPDRWYGQLFGTSSGPLGVMLPTGRFWPPRRYHPARPSQCQAKIIRTLQFALRYNPDTSLLCGEIPNEQLDATAGRPEADVRVNHGKPIPESRPARRAFNTPNAAGVSRDTDAGPDCAPRRTTGQPAGSSSQRRDANGTTACTTAARRQATS